MELDKLILIFGYFLVFVKFTPILADGTHGHAVSVPVENMQSSCERFSEDIKVNSEVLKIPHDFKKIINLDIVQYSKADVVLGTSSDEYVTFDLQTYSQYSFQKPSVFIQSSTVQTENDLYINFQLTEEPGGLTDYVIMTLVVGFCVLVLLSKLMNYKSKYKSQSKEKVCSDEDLRGLMWNFGNLEDFWWKRKEKKNIQIVQENNTETESHNEKTSKNNNGVLDKRNGYHISGRKNNQSKCSLHKAYWTHRMKLSPIGQNKRLTWTFGVGILLFLSVAAVLAVKNFKQRHVLKIDIPQGALIRKIRSYTDNPDLSAISLNSSSMGLVTRLQLLPTSCLTDKSQCETYAMCDTELGQLTCRCKRGFYIKDRKCQECATSCREGNYMSRACTASSDVICRPCSTCRGASYEVAQCSSTQDTICIGAAFPVPDVKWNKLLHHSTNTSVSLTSSENVFFEKLSGIKTLGSSMYIPNNAQVQEFELQREAGLHVKVKVSNLYLVPQYIDLDHEDDFMYINTDTFQLESNKEQYREIRKKYCRHQIPDHYKIVLYITRNHTSAAREVTCNSHDSSVPQCPADYKNGDKFLDRQINTECPYKVSGEKNQYFERFEQRTNNIYCHHTTQLFTDTFGLTPEETSNYTFPSADCHSSSEACRNCLRSPNCKSYEGQCCDINCYTQESCQKAYSENCPQKHIECASGDVHNFVLEPVFSSVDSRFMCHMKYKKPNHLYQLDYTVYMPSIGYTLPKRTKFAKGDNSFNEKGTYTSEFIKATHDAFPQINDEVILIGSNFKNKHPTQFWIHELKKPHDFNTRKKFKVRPHRATIGSSNIYSTHAQVERPFLYSTSVFYKGGCLGKNFSNFYPPQPIYLHNSIEVDPSITKTGAGIEYQMAHSVRSAYMRISLDNSSILTHFQDDLGKTSLDGSSLSGGLVWNPRAETWSITLKGDLQSCPGYFTVDVFDQFMDSMLDNFDIFVKCPVNFQLTFDLGTPFTDLPNVFVARLNDSFVSHHILMSVIHPPVYPPSEYSLTTTNDNTYQFPWIPMIITLIFTAIIFSAFVVAFMIIHRMEPVQAPEVKKYISPQTTTYIGAKDDDRNVNQPLTLTLFSKPVSKSVSCTLCVLYFVYAIMFTFSMILGVFYIVQGPLVGNLTIVSNTSAKIHQSVGVHMTKISQYEEKELRSAFNQTFNRMKACSVHLRQSMDKIEKFLSEDVKNVLKKLYSSHGLLKSVINSTMVEKVHLIEKKLGKFLTETEAFLESNFSQIQQNYTKLLESLRDNKWLQFPKDRFSDQQFIVGQEETFRGLKDFMKWLEIDGVESVLNIDDIIMNRLKKSIKDLVPAKLQASSNFHTVPSSQRDPDLKIGQNSKFGFQVLEPPEEPWILANLSDSSEQSSEEPLSDTLMSKAKMIDRMKNIMLPVFICFFLVMDVLMLLYRFVWLGKIWKKAKMGIDIKVPTDDVAEKIQFWQTGHNNRKLENPSTENPYNFYSENKEDMWSGKNDPIQLYTNTAQKSKQEILRELWNKKQKQKRLSYMKKKNHSVLFKTVLSVSTFLYKHLIAPILWRFVLVGAFVLVICLVTKATSDLVSIETATFLIDTKSIIPQLHRQVDITNRLIWDVTSDLNLILKEHKSLVDIEVASINSFLTNQINSKNEVLQTILTDLCASGGEEFCAPSLLRVQDLMTSCNFLPVSTLPFKEMDEGLFVHYLHSELLPLVNTLRQILFNTCYILFVYACLMLICHTFIRIVIFYLIRTSRLPKSMIYLVSNTNDCWKVNEGSATKSMYRSNSCIESCESGVVGDIEDHRESNM